MCFVPQENCMLDQPLLLLSSKAAEALLLSLFNLFSVHFVNVINNAILKSNVSVGFYFSVFKPKAPSPAKDPYLHLEIAWNAVP